MGVGFGGGGGTGGCACRVEHGLGSGSRRVWGDSGTKGIGEVRPPPPLWGVVWGGEVGRCADGDEGAPTAPPPARPPGRALSSQLPLILGVRL